MKRRGFLKTLAGLASLPVAAKAGHKAEYADAVDHAAQELAERVDRDIIRAPIVESPRLGDTVRMYDISTSTIKNVVLDTPAKVDFYKRSIRNR